MIVKNLTNTSFDEILECFLAAFENYFVKMPTDKTYYEKRWEAAKVDFKFSYGMFDDGKLIGFIIHAIDKRTGLLTAFNTGTGVLPAYRGNKMVKRIYDYALNDLIDNGIEKTSLEVITKNIPAIKSYESVGFKICKNYKCYGGTLNVQTNETPHLKEIPIPEVAWDSLPNQKYYSWDFQKECINRGTYQVYHVLYNGNPESYFIINTENNTIAQCDLFQEHNEAWERLFAAIKSISKNVRLINVDERLESKIAFIEAVGLENTIDQYEMEMGV